MPIRLFVNELSFPIDDCAFEQAAERLDALVAAFRAVKAIDPQMRIDSAVPLSQLQIAANWPLAALRNQARCKEAGLYVRRLEDRAPFTHAIAEVPDDIGGGPEYHVPAEAPVCAGEISLGMGLAHRLDGVSISLATHAGWARPSIDLDCHMMNIEGEIHIARVAARNALDASGINVHAPHLSELVQPTVHDGAEIWGRRGELFPHLGFIPRVEEQLSSLQKGNLLVSVVLDRLLKLDTAIGTWRDTGVEHPPYSYYIRRESSSREKYAWFSDEGGVSQLFSLHGDYAPGENRYHFRLEETPIRRAVVGHIGRKLGI